MMWSEKGCENGGKRRETRSVGVRPDTLHTCAGVCRRVYVHLGPEANLWNSSAASCWIHCEAEALIGPELNK